MKPFIHNSITVMVLCASIAVNAQSTLIRNVSVISPEATHAITIQNVLVDDGRIKALNKTAMSADRIIDATGKYLIPGLIDGHVHLEDIPGMSWDHITKYPNLAKQARAQFPRNYLYFGFTSVIDLMSNEMKIKAWNEQALRPDAYYCIGVPIANGYPMAWLPESQRFDDKNTTYTLYDERQKATLPAHFDPVQHSPKAIVKKIEQSDATCIKTFHESGFGRLKNLPNPTPKMMNTMIDRAHRAGLPVLMHGNSQASHEFAVEVGADIIAHGMWHWKNKTALSPTPDILSLLDSIANTQIGYQPTIQVIVGEQELFNDAYFDIPAVRHAIPAVLIAWYQSDEGKWMQKDMAKHLNNLSPEARYKKVKENYALPINRLKQVIAILASKNARLLFGSDTPSGPFYTQFHGVNGYLEIQRLVEAGVPLDTLLRSMTIDNAKAFGLEKDIGTIQKGKIANLLLLNKNPLLSAEAYNTIDYIFLHGKAIPRASLSAGKNIKNK